MSWGFVVVRGGVSKNKKKIVKTDMIFLFILRRERILQTENQTRSTVCYCFFS